MNSDQQIRLRALTEDRMNRSVAQDLAGQVDRALADEQVQARARQFLAEEFEAMRERGDFYQLSDDEERMLIAYRGFLATHVSGQPFSWQPPAPAGIMLPAEQPMQLIQDPRQL